MTGHRCHRHHQGDQEKMMRAAYVRQIKLRFHSLNISYNMYKHIISILFSHCHFQGRVAAVIRNPEILRNIRINIISQCSYLNLRKSERLHL